MKLETAGRTLMAAWVAWLVMAPWALLFNPPKVVDAAPYCHPARAVHPAPLRTRGLVDHRLPSAYGVLSPTACPANLIALWEMGDASVPPLVDSARDHDGTCSPGECPISTAGVVDSAQVFSTTTEVNVPAHIDFNWGVNDSFSFEYWLQSDSASTCAGNQVIIGRDVTSGPDTNLHWWTGCVAGGTAAFYARDLGGTLFSVQGTTDVTDGNWHHVVAVRDADADQLRLYVDGTLEASVAAVYTQGFGTSTTALNIGWLLAGNIYHFQGNLDELAVYARALGEPEIDQHIATNLAGENVCADTTVLPYKVYLPTVLR